MTIGNALSSGGLTCSFGGLSMIDLPPMAMTTLWETPSPSSGFIDGIRSKNSPGVLASSRSVLKSRMATSQTCELRFHDVAALRCTYLPALSADLIRSAYDKLVDIRSSAWLSEANSIRPDAQESLRHLRICFDDGPCFEFLCRGFDIVGDVADRPDTSVPKSVRGIRQR